MGTLSNIEWCDHTFNPWVGCTRLSAACDFCYAETWAQRAGSPDLWQGERRRTTVANWRLPLKWDRMAAAEGRRYRVFCASLADVFDNQVPAEWRADLWELIGSTRNLDWLLLTKRPQNIAKMLPVMDSGQPGYRPWNMPWPWPNVWLGTTVENQQEADRRIPHLLAVPAAIRFLSCEPLLGPVSLRDWTYPVSTGRNLRDPAPFSIVRSHPVSDVRPGLDGVICGGESGPGARPMHPDWARSLRDQCVAAGVAFLFKQWGEWGPAGDWYENHPVSLPLRAWAGTAWTDDSSFEGEWVVRIGKKRAGRHLDGRIWDEMPRSAA